MRIERPDLELPTTTPQPVQTESPSVVSATGVAAGQVEHRSEVVSQVPASWFMFGVFISLCCFILRVLALI